MRWCDNFTTYDDICSSDVTTVLLMMTYVEVMWQLYYPWWHMLKWCDNCTTYDDICWSDVATVLLMMTLCWSDVTTVLLMMTYVEVMWQLYYPWWHMLKWCDNCTTYDDICWSDVATVLLMMTLCWSDVTTVLPMMTYVEVMWQLYYLWWHMLKWCNNCTTYDDICWSDVTTVLPMITCVEVM